MPFENDLGQIKAWSAALGSGTMFETGMEIFLVVTSELDRVAAERVLDSWYRQYRVASRLVVALSDAGARAPYAAGAAAATRDHLIFLDAGCFPTDGGSLSALISALDDPHRNRVVAGIIADPLGAVRQCGFLTPAGDNRSLHLVGKRAPDHSRGLPPWPSGHRQ